MELKLKTTDRSKPFYTETVSTGAYTGDSGFDLYFVQTVTIPAKTTALVSLDISVEIKDDTGFKSSLLMARSSIYKTPLRLSNSVGLIDSGYRGLLKVPLDNTSETDYVITKGERLCQLVCADLKPFSKVSLTTQLQETERGSNGFGSSGK